MAQIVSALATNQMRKPEVIKEFYLYNVFGYSNFKAAVDDAIARKMDVISYSEVWEYGGNSDGKGFINAQVSRATAAGITWVNAAGNFGLTTYNSGITTLQDDWVQLPDQNRGLAIRCEIEAPNKCNIKVVLSWNDFKDDIVDGTNKDLDMALADDLLNIVQSSALKQSDDPNENRPGFSKYPREILTAQIGNGTFYLRVKNRSKNFDSGDRLRITVDGEGISVPSHTKGESVYNPGDNPSVITVGATDSDRSSVSIRMNKPDVMAPSSMILENGAEFRGSSNATAVVAAGFALLKSLSESTLSRSEITKQSSVGYTWDRGALSLQALAFYPTRNGCFVDRDWAQAPAYIRSVLDAGGVLVDTSAQVRIVVPFDPLMLTQNLSRRFVNDMVVALADGSFAVYPRNSAIPYGAIEVFQRPLEAGLCTVPG
ncbi:MAG: protease, partial [Proteobacteria bacterium]